jgi:hypothetical protein
MHSHKGTTGRRLGRKTAILGSVAGAMIAATAFVPAFASPVSGTATGSTALTLGGKAVTLLQGGGCGPLGVTGSNGVTTSTVGKGSIRIVFPITGYEVQPSDADAFRLDHSGGVTLENSCYSIAISGLRITNFGLANQGSSFDISALTKSIDDSGRQVIGTIDLTGSNLTTISSTKYRITNMSVLTSSEGAEELNELTSATSNDGTIGPFSAGMKVGTAKTLVHFTS